MAECKLNICVSNLKLLKKKFITHGDLLNLTVMKQILMDIELEKFLKFNINKVI